MGSWNPAVPGPKVWSVYCLESFDGRNTYVGSSVNPDHRLRQHNGEIKGGAKATAARGPGAWHRAAFLQGFDKTAALQFEWRWKRLTRRAAGASRLEAFGPRAGGLEKRLAALAQLLRLERPTKAARPLAEYIGGLTLFVETERASELWAAVCLAQPVAVGRTIVRATLAHPTDAIAT